MTFTKEQVRTIYDQTEIEKIRQSAQNMRLIGTWQTENVANWLDAFASLLEREATEVDMLKWLMDNPDIFGRGIPQAILRDFHIIPRVTK